jgi:hypothetical protein
MPGEDRHAQGFAVLAGLGQASQDHCQVGCAGAGEG